jgi:hypothetical protein
LSVLLKKQGIKKILQTVFYIVSLHWLFQAIIKVREGYFSKQTIGRAVENVIENDNEIVDGIMADQSSDCDKW